VPGLTKLFQDETRRLARKEMKADLDILRKENVELRRSISALRQQLVQVTRQVRQIERSTGKLEKAIPQEEATGAERARISGKTIRNLRSRLRLTQAEFAALVGVSPQSVYQWERREDQLQFRGGAKEAIVALKDVGAREARRRLEKKKS